MRRQVVVAAAMLAAGCGKEGVKELDVYRYRVHVDEAVESSYSIGSN